MATNTNAVVSSPGVPSSSAIPVVGRAVLVARGVAVGALVEAAMGVEVGRLVDVAWGTEVAGFVAVGGWVEVAAFVAVAAWVAVAVRVAVAIRVAVGGWVAVAACVAVGSFVEVGAWGVIVCAPATCVSKALRVATASSTVDVSVGPITTMAVLVGRGVFVGLGVNDGEEVGCRVVVAVGTAAVWLTENAMAVDWAAVVAAACCVAFWFGRYRNIANPPTHSKAKTMIPARVPAMIKNVRFPFFSGGFPSPNSCSTSFMSVKAIMPLLSAPQRAQDYYPITSRFARGTWTVSPFDNLTPAACALRPLGRIDKPGNKLVSVPTMLI